MDKGAKFVLNNIKKTLDLIDNNDKYKDLRGKAGAEFNFLKSFTKTGDLYDHFLKFKNEKHEYADNFAFLSDYGITPNERLSDYLKEHFPEELNNKTSISDIRVNNKYSSNEIKIIFKYGGRMRGMIRCNKTNSLVLISNKTNYLYNDTWNENGVFYYTGEGQEGDQQISGQNKTLAESNNNGINVYLFESYKPNSYYYRGQVKLSVDIFTDKERDKNGKLRTVLKFPLKRLNNDTEILITEKDYIESERNKLKEVKKLNKDQIKKIAKEIEIYPNGKEVVIKSYERNQIVSEYTKQRANGTCDLCKNSAPFIKKDGTPYLETHHVVTLANGGPDVIYNTVALCPNCHRKMHDLENKKDLDNLIKTLHDYLSIEQDQELLNRFKKLFENY